MAGRLFISRLDEARSPASGSAREVSKRSSGTTEENHSQLSATRALFRDNDRDSDAKHAQGQRSEVSLRSRETKYGDHSEILEKLAEYLFDLFDANAMDDFAKMEKFEIRALESFQNCDETEYTHEQHALHSEFTTLFEQLIEGFLESEGYTIDVFYDELVHYTQKSKLAAGGKAKLPLCPADEVMEVVSNYLQFDVWADLMRQQSKQQAAFRTMREQVQDAYKAAQDSNEHGGDGPAAINTGEYK
jgi:hypothetical protein